jgi:hypothetical protein
LSLAAEYGPARVHELVTRFAARFPGFPVPPTIAAGRLAAVRANVVVERDGEVGVVRVFRPEVRKRAVGPDHRRAGRRRRRAGRRSGDSTA